MLEITRYVEVTECPRADEHIDGEDEDHGLVRFWPNLDPHGNEPHPLWIGYCPDTAAPIFLATDSEGKEVVLAAD